MFNSFEELAEVRKNGLEWVRKNNWKILEKFTKIYPDKAHFIYELLQNAEDMDATLVEFSLFKDKLVFKHNGKKRNFTLNDVEAITGFENNEDKQEDETSIGKFGIGFKAVFAYTDTPEIHSGDMHFKIENIVVPSKENVKKISSKDEKGINWTIFIFPFNREAKSPEKAYNEISNSLKELDFNSIIFLKNIKKINYVINKNEKGFVRLVESEKPNYITIEASNNKKSTWLRFSDLIDFVDEIGNNKKLSIGIAYNLEYSEKNRSYQIKETNGKAFVYFPAVKEHTGLRFLINAPFSTTQARDSIIDSEENEELTKKIASLVVKSLDRIKELGLMNNSFFNVLPNEKDYLTSMYNPIYLSIKEAFKENDYLPTQTGEYVNSSNALIGSKRISDIVNQDFLKSVAGITKNWIQNASVESNANKFLRSLGIEEFTSEKFFELFDDNHGSNLESYLGMIRTNKTLDEYSKNGIITDEDDENLDDKTRKKIVEEAKKNTCIWFRKFYELCIEEYNSIKYGYEKYSINELLKKRKIILSEDLKIFKSSEIYFKEKKDNKKEEESDNENVEFKTDVNYVNSYIANQDEKNDIPYNNWQFFKNTLCIKTFDTKEYLLWKLNNKYSSNSNFKLDDEYLGDIILFSLSQDNINFKDYPIFVYYEDGKYYSTRGYSLVLGEKYGNAHDQLLSKIYNKKIISDFYYDKLCDLLERQNVEDVYIYDKMLEFFKICGVIDSVVIENGKASNHKYFNSKLYYQGNRSSCAINIDFYIPNIKLLFQNDGFNKYLWDFLKKQEKNDWALAKYRANAKGETRTCDSTLICDLKEIAWLPDKDGNLRKPADISLEELRDDFKYIDKEKNEIIDFENYPLLKALDIKEKPIDTEKMYEDTANILLSKIGKRAISEERYQKFLKWEQEEAEREEKARKRREQKKEEDIDELFDGMTRENVDNDDDEIISIGCVNNVERYGRKIEKHFVESKEIEPKLRIAFRNVYKSSKEEHDRLGELYKGECQICGTRIVSYKNKFIFQAINVIHTKNLPTDISNTENLCWNSLCLCPNCAAEYKNCSLDISDVPRQVSEKEVNEKDSTKIEIEINLNNKKREIKYVPKHFLALKTVLNLLKQNK